MREAKSTQAKAKSGAGAKEVYKDWDSDKKYKDRQKSKKKDMPKSAATKAYHDKFSEDDVDELFKENGLKEKAKKSGIPLGILKQVYKKGMAAWQGGHRPGVSPQQWAMARVNSFITGSGGARKADAELWKRASKAKRKK